MAPTAVSSGTAGPSPGDARGPGALPLRQVHAGHDHRSTYQLPRPEALTEQHDARAYAYKGYEVLVDQDAVGPGPRDTPAPGGEAEGRREEHRVRAGGPRRRVDGRGV